jgi:hypothetical protein
MVVEARDKYQPVVLIFTLLLMPIVGCGSDSAPKDVDQAISRAVSQLEIYGGSQAVSFWGRTPSTMPAMQNVKQKCDEQTQKFVKAMNDLKVFADKQAEDAQQSKKTAFAKWLTGVMMFYQGRMEAGDVKMMDAREANVQDKVLLSSLNVRLLKSQEAAVSPANFDEAVKQSQDAIDAQKKVLEKASAQLSGVVSVLEKLKADLVKAQKERDDLNIRIGELTSKLANVPAAEGVKIQKQINELDTKRFGVLVTIQKFEAGPLTLAEGQSVTVDDRQLTQVSGIRQIEEEKAFLETRVAKAEEGIKAQETFLKNLEQQKNLADEKKQSLAKQLAAAGERLKTDLQALSALVAERSSILTNADKDLSGAARYAQQSDSDLKQYLSAVQNAAGNAAGEDNYLKAAKGLEELAYNIGVLRAEAQLAQLRLKENDIRFLESVSAILQGCGSAESLPANLADLLKDSSEKIKSMKDEVSKTAEGIVAQYETLYRNASRSNLKPIIAANLVEAMNMALSLVPEKAKEYQDKIKEIMGQTLPDASANNSDPLLGPAKKLQQTLGL